jgi:hypothetical protein
MLKTPLQPAVKCHTQKKRRQHFYIDWGTPLFPLEILKICRGENRRQIFHSSYGTSLFPLEILKDLRR